MNKAVFLDRDGTLNTLVYYPNTDEFESPRTPEELQMIPGIAAPLRQLQVQGWQLFLISNQPSYAKGKTSLENLQAVHDRLIAHLAAEGITFQGCYYSYGHPKGVIPAYTFDDPDRKPKPGMLFKARDQHDVDLTQSWMIGDQDSDILCGQQAGCKTILIPTAESAHKRGSSQPNWQCVDLNAAVAIILKEDIHERQRS